MGQLICSICGDSFPDIKTGSAGQRAEICGKPECAKIRSRKYYLKWKATHMDQCKKHQHAQYERRKKWKQPEYFTKDTPQPKIKRRCQFPGCKRLTARGGINYLWCQQHWDLKQESISQEYGEYIFMDGDFDDISMTPTLYYDRSHG